MCAAITFAEQSYYRIHVMDAMIRFRSPHQWTASLVLVTATLVSTGCSLPKTTDSAVIDTVGEQNASVGQQAAMRRTPPVRPSGKTNGKRRVQAKLASTTVTQEPSGPFEGQIIEQPPAMGQQAGGGPEFGQLGFSGQLHGSPRELSKVILPTYRIEPPDMLQIDAISVVPKSPYHLKVLDSLVVQVEGALLDAPIQAEFPIGPGGSINLGQPYGQIKVTGMTVDEAKVVIEKHLASQLKEPAATVALGNIGAKQQITGPHMVGPDGTVTLGSYGSVRVVGMTIAQAKTAIEKHLEQLLEEPEVSVDVLAYNSKVYYVVTQGAGLGDSVARFPITGNETVLDAITLVNGLTSVSSKKIWIARPGHNGQGNHQILHVDWIAVTQMADTETNFQILPGDRIYIAEDRFIAMDSFIGKVLAPAERLLGFISLGTSTVSSLRFFKQQGLRGRGTF